MKRSPETFLAICARLEKSPKVNKACTAVGITERLYYKWIERSQAGEPDMVFDYIDERTPFHVAVKHAVAIYTQSLAAHVEDVALNGYERQTFFRGQPQYHLKDSFKGRNIAELPPDVDPWERDAEGNLVPVLEHHPAPVQLQLAVLAGRMPKVYGTRISHDVTSRVNLGVHVVKPKSLAPPQPVEVVQPSLPAPDNVTEGEFSDLDFLGPAPEPYVDPEESAKNEYWQAQLDAVEPEPVRDWTTDHPVPKAPICQDTASGILPKSPDQTGPNPLINKSSSPMRQRLEALVAEQRAKAGPAPTLQPPAPTNRSTSVINEHEGIGRGTVPPGAIKVS
jgi:hypothetical protein